jgi:oxaloacetate decarboxylase (Na+ extruding) subunit gamma
MMTDSVLMQGFDLLIVGMGTVFAFLGLLVATMTMMSRIAMRFRGAPPPAGTSDDEIAAIGAAIARHRRQ